MINKDYKSRAKALVKKAKDKGLVRSYNDFCNTDFSKETMLCEEEVSYYIAKNKEESDWKNMLSEI